MCGVSPVIDERSEAIGYAVHYEREKARKESDRRIWLTLDLLIARLTAERDGHYADGHVGQAAGLDRAIEILTISRDAHA